LTQLGERLADAVEGVLILAMALDQGLIDRERVGPAALERELDGLLDEQAARLYTFFRHQAPVRMCRIKRPLRMRLLRSTAERSNRVRYDTCSVRRVCSLCDISTPPQR